MVRKSYEGYDYIDPDSLYTYEQSSVLINNYDRIKQGNSSTDWLQVRV